MTRRASSLWVLPVSIAVIAAARPVAAQHSLHPFYTNSRAQIGDGLPIPITLTPPPHGPVRPAPGATAMQGTTTMQGTETVNRAVTLSQGALSRPASTRNVGVALNNSLLLQVQTSLAIEFPIQTTVMFVANGRSGPDLVQWCPGFPVPTTSFNPACTDPSTSTPIDPPVNSSLSYARTANNLGGVAQLSVVGMGPGGRGALVAVRAANPPPCALVPLGNCRAAFDEVVPAATGASGGSFGFTNMTPGGPPVNPGLFNVAANALGTITVITTPGLPVNGFTNMATSWGGPWTAGVLEVVALTAAGMAETFTLTGADTPTAGGGRRLSLVTGAVSQRTVSKPNANRGWLNLYLPEPRAGLATFAALLVLAACHGRLRRGSR